jgi:hypothetical protein
LDISADVIRADFETWIATDIERIGAAGNFIDRGGHLETALRSPTRSPSRTEISFGYARGGRSTSRWPLP